MARIKVALGLRKNILSGSRWKLTVIRRTRFTPEFRVLLYRILTALLVVTLVVLIEGVALWFMSESANPSISTPIDGIYFVVVNIFGETTSPSSLGARIITLIALIEGMVLATYLIAVSAYFTIGGGRIMTREYENHYVICGWNFQGSRIVRELLDARQHFDIVILPGEDKPAALSEFGNKIFTVLGSPTEDSILTKANVQNATAVIVLSDTNLDTDSADARSVLITLAVETLNPAVYTCVQLMNSHNEVHLRRANVDEIIPIDVLGANLAVASALNPGITKVVNELLHFGEGSEFYRLPPPVHPDLVGATFKEAAVWFTAHDMILIGVESDELIDSFRAGIEENSRLSEHLQNAKGLAINPRAHRIKESDALFLIADDDPAESLR